MKNKYYYTPTIEEFYVGFEFELKDYLEYQIDKDVHVLDRGWGKQIASFDFFTKNKLMPYFLQSTRVKYLDQSDIESLGWVMDKPYYFKLGTQYELNFIEEEHKLTIYYHNQTTDLTSKNKVIWDGWTIFFSGVIKNKSEFKKLMQQLDIK
jgi:hypothetical protein